ncbi:unannotated protein [freshwater metagenome]
MALSWAEMVATSAIWDLPLTAVEFFRNASVIADTACSIPYFSSIGWAPAAKLRRPSLTMACAKTVAVVVPSPATSLVFSATCLTS